MYFRDAEGKWHKCANESEKRDAELLEAGTWKTLQALKVITFPIEKAKTLDDEILQKDKRLEAYKQAEIDKEIDAQLAEENKTVELEKK